MFIFVPKTAICETAIVFVETFSILQILIYFTNSFQVLIRGSSSRSFV